MKFHQDTAKRLYRLILVDPNELSEHLVMEVKRDPVLVFVCSAAPAPTFRCPGSATKKLRVEGTAYGRGTRLRIADESPVVTLKGDTTLGWLDVMVRSNVSPQATAAAEEMPEECSQTPAGAAPGGGPAEPDLPNRNTESNTKAEANTAEGRKR